MIDEVFNDTTGPILESETNKLKNLMKDKYYLEVETFNNLNCYENMVFLDWNIKYCDCWGDLGREFRDFFYKNQSRLFFRGKFNQPEVFMKLINLYFSNYPFREYKGKGEYFQIGALFHILISEGQEIYVPNSEESELYRIKFVWNILFCSMYKCIPKSVINQENNITLGTLKVFINRLKKAEKMFRLSIENKKNKYAYDMGKKYAYYSEMIPKSFRNYMVVEGCIFLDDDEYILELIKYFVDEFKALIKYIKSGSEISEESLIVLESICINNNIWHPDWTVLNNENDINKRKKYVFDGLKKFCRSVNIEELNISMFTEEYVCYHLRNLLNINSELDLY